MMRPEFDKEMTALLAVYPAPRSSEEAAERAAYLEACWRVVRWIDGSRWTDVVTQALSEGGKSKYKPPQPCVYIAIYHKLKAEKGWDPAPPHDRNQIRRTMSREEHETHCELAALALSPAGARAVLKDGDGKNARWPTRTMEILMALSQEHDPNDDEGDDDAPFVAGGEA